MAAATALPRFVGEQELNPEGHTTRIIETIQFSCHGLQFDFEKSFTFKCRENPTSWSLRLTFHRDMALLSVICEVTIQRLDSSPVDVGTDFWLNAKASLAFYAISSPNFKAEGMLPNHQRRIIFDFMPEMFMNPFVNLPVQLEMFFRIRRCHGDLAGPVGAVHQERFIPPTDFEDMFVAAPPRKT